MQFLVMKTKQNTVQLTEALCLPRYCPLFSLPPRPSWLSTPMEPWLRLTRTMLPPPRSTSLPWLKPVPLLTPTTPTLRTWQSQSSLLCTTGNSGLTVAVKFVLIFYLYLESALLSPRFSELTDW